MASRRHSVRSPRFSTSFIVARDPTSGDLGVTVQSKLITDVYDEMTKSALWDFSRVSNLDER
jgi:hypothetical protein